MICLFLLSLTELRRLAAETNKAERGEEREEARLLLDRLANSDASMSIDLTDVWSRWKSWLAIQNASTDSFDANIVGFTADFIENTRDVNRGGRQRMDFCAHLADGSYWRFHPGKRSSQDAQPR